MKKTHVLVRTNPKGEIFVGRCTLCGKEGLPTASAFEVCENPKKISQDDAFVSLLK